MKRETIRTLDELISFINEMSKIHCLRLWYRGIEDAKWELVPAIQRSDMRIKKERFLANDFYIRTKQILEKCPDKKNYAAWMSLMQHFGLPTRLLDWSQSPLIAMFFATETYKKVSTDAGIWVLAPGKLNEEEGFGDCIFPIDADTSQNMLLPAFKDVESPKELRNKIIACHSTENNLRMYSQQANFTVHNSLKKLEDICDSDMLYQMIIPADRKEYFWKILQVFGITEGFVYPDPDHISKDLTQLHGI